VRLCQHLKHAGIILFCLWHMTAVFIHALPHLSDNPAILWIRTNALPIVRPYMLITSQWQQWNLFSPDPLRRVSSYRIEWNDNGLWHLVNEQPGSLPWWRRAPRVKILNRLFENNRRRTPLQERFVRTIACDPNVIPMRSAHLRLFSDTYVIPSDRRSLLSFYWWKKIWKPDIKTLLRFETICPL
jgi:hypothetical protein